MRAVDLFMAAVGGRRGRGPRPVESLGWLERKSRESFRTPPEMIPMKRNKMVLLDDLDPATGKLRPDYLARREARRQGPREPRAFGSSNHNIDPD